MGDPDRRFYSVRWFVAYTVGASVGLFVFYHTISGGFPWHHGSGLISSKVWGPWLLLPWAVFIGMLVVSRRDRGFGQRLPAKEMSPEAGPDESSAAIQASAV